MHPLDPFNPANYGPSGPSVGGVQARPRNFLPVVTWTPPISPVASQASLNSVASTPQDTQAQMVAENAPLRVIYGRVRIGAQVADVLAYQNDLIMLLVWGEGEINSIESVTVGDAAPPAGITLTHYTGTAGQVADATLIAAYASPGVTYADALPGIAYSVARIPVGITNGVPMFAAILQGRQLYDERQDSTNGGSGAQRLATPSTWVYSDNPALALADFKRSTLYGEGRAVDSASVIATADFCDELCGTEKRRLIGLVLDTTQPCAQWSEALRTYAGCFISQEGASLRLIPDKPGSVVHHFTASNIQADSLKLKKRGVQNVPTVIDIRYTDTSVTPWAQKSALAKVAGVDAGTTPRRESQVSLPGVTRYSQAYREAVERLNKLQLSDLPAGFDTFDEALAVQVGDLGDITHPIGLTAKQVRIMGAKIADAGRWQITALEYDPACYSDAVASSPTYTDTELPDPSAPPAVTALAMSEEVFQLANGTYSSRWRITWAAASYPYLAHYRAELWEGTTLIHTSTAREAVWATPAIQEGVNYTAKVVAVSAIGSTGTWATQSALAQGKQLVPGDVPSVSVFEAGGRVYISWPAAVDLDIWRYDVRYGAVGGTYATATSIDHVDALRLQSDQIPVGTWTLYVKAEDSIGQYSVNAATCSVTVTSDTSAFLVDTLHQTNPGLTNMASYTLAPTDPNIYYITEDGVAWNTKFSAAVDSYTNPLSTYHNSVTSTWLGESEDFGQLLGGSWTGTATVADVSGSHISYLGSSVEGSAWSYLSGLSQKLNARFARMKHEALTTSTLGVTIPTQSIRIDAVPREEVGSGTSSATNATTVFLANDYVSTKKIGITVLGTSAASHVEDNIGRNAPNPADKHANIIVTGNTITRGGTAAWNFIRSRHPLPSSGVWYFGVKINTLAPSYSIAIGIATRSASLTDTYTTASSVFYLNNGNKYVGGTGSAYGATYGSDDHIGVKYDADLGKITFYRNNTSQGEITGLSGEKFICCGEYYGNESITLQIAESDFSYPAPSGALPLPYAFDEHIFDTAGARVARNFLWSHQGV